MAKKTANRNMKKSRREKSLEELPAFNDDQDMGSDKNVRRSSSRGSRGGAVLSADQERDYREILREFITSPAAKYIAGGIATALLTRLANRLSDRYPEISEFIRENMDMLEGRMGEFRSCFEGGNTASRH